MLNFDTHDLGGAVRTERPSTVPDSRDWLKISSSPKVREYAQNLNMPARRSGLSLRILKTLIEHGDSALLGDDSRVLLGHECLAPILDLGQAVRTVTPRGGRVAILFPPSIAQSISILSVMMSGRVPVILNHWTDKKELSRIVTENHIHSLLTFPQESSDQLPAVPVIEFTDELSIFKSTNPGLLDKPLPAASTALILYTSGSTGQSKPVLLSEESLMYMIDHLIERLNLNSSTVATITLPIFHTMALITQFFPTFFAGGRSIIVNTELSTGKLYRLISSSGGTFIALISDMLKYCKEEKEKRNMEPAKDVKLLQLAGGHISTSHLELAREIFPNAVIYKGYGLTEAIRVAMISSDHPLFLEDSAGFALPGQQISIRDELGVELPRGEDGEIHVKGPNLMIGYEGDVPSRFTADGYLSTGDFGLLSPDGLVVIRGRRDDVFKSNGRKIAAREIEEIAIELPEILRAKCLSVECPQKGLRPILLVEIDRDTVDCESKIWKDDLVTLLKVRLDAFKVPKDVVVTMLPQLANGKLDQSATSAIWGKKETFQYLGKATFGCHFHSF
jgi:acyl-CoA synthetase (AMP-forming)/AMP-acid ligase II